MPCWKCQKPTVDGVVECSACSGEMSFSEEAAYNYEVDWALPKTADDFRKILAALPEFRISVKGGSPEFEKLKPWLRRRS